MKIDPGQVGRRDIHEILVAAIMPRPIAWVSTVDEAGIFNLAPFSFFTSVSLKPPVVCLSIGWRRDGQKKDTLRNIESTGDFVVNIVDEGLAGAMNQTSAEYPPEADEFREVGLTPVKGELVKSPLVGESPINMECRLMQVLQFGEKPDGGTLVLAEIVRFHVRDELYVNGEIDVSKLTHIGRLGEQLYCRIRDSFRMERPYIL